MLGLDSERLEDIGREVLEVLRHDDLGMAANGGSQDVSVVGVRENKPFDERLVSGDEAVGDRFAHQLACPVELGSLEVRAAVENAADHLVECLVCPAGSEGPGLGESDQQVPEAGGVEDVRVVDDGEGHCVWVSSRGRVARLRGSVHRGLLRDVRRRGAYRQGGQRASPCVGCRRGGRGCGVLRGA